MSGMFFETQCILLPSGEWRQTIAYTGPILLKVFIRLENTSRPTGKIRRSVVYGYRIATRKSLKTEFNSGEVTYIGPSA